MTAQPMTAKPMTAQPRLQIVHVAAATGAMALILIFQVSTITSEIAGSAAAIAAVKTAIVVGLFLLAPTLATAGLSGMRLAGGAPKGLALRKLNRMKLVAANGLLVLIPAAIFLRHSAVAGEFGYAFAIVQAAELAAGALNLTLLGLNLRDGLRMGRGRRAARAAAAQSSVPARITDAIEK